jgi:mono/diheme cytochrome c family protein
LLGRLAGRALLCAAAAVTAAPAAALGNDPGDAAGPLRVCADPDNLPFSSASGPSRGFYLDLAERLVQALGRPLQVVWYPDHGARGVRASLVAGLCDLQVGLPADGFMERRLAMSQPFASFGYALVFPRGSAARTVDDLRGKRIAVQLGSPPQTVIALRDDIEAVTVRSPEEGIWALRDDLAEGAWLWGPSVGFAMLGTSAAGDPGTGVPGIGDRGIGNRGAGDPEAGNRGSETGRLRLEPAPPGPGMRWPVAIGVRRDHVRLKQQMDRALDQIAAGLPALAATYGIELAAPPTTERVTTDRVTTDRARTGRATVPVPDSGFVSVADVANSAGSSSAGGEVEAGRVIFNTHCSHCHGPNAESPDQRIDLRRLSRRYRDDKDAVFETTVHDGRPDKGMPPWKGIIAEPEITKLKAYVDSVQTRK